MRGGDCGERDAGRGLWVGDCGERSAGRELWGKLCGEGKEGGMTKELKMNVISATKKTPGWGEGGGVDV